MCLAADEVEQVAQLFFCGSEIDAGLFAQFNLDQYSLEMIKLKFGSKLWMSSHFFGSSARQRKKRAGLSRSRSLISAMGRWGHSSCDRPSQLVSVNALWNS